jgi:adenylate cyclase
MKQASKLVQRVGPFLGALIVLILVRSTGIAQTIDLLIYDLVTSERKAPSGQNTQITLIGVDESDIQRFGWPIEDGLFCKAFDKLNSNGIDAIGFDIYRDKGVGPNQQCLRDRFRHNPKLISIFNVAAGINAVPGTPIERQSYNDLSLDADGVLRRDLVHVTGQNEATVSFAMRVMEVASGDDSLRRAIDRGNHPSAWLSANSGGYHDELDAGLGLQRLLTFREPGSYREYSLAELLDGDIPIDAMQGQIALIGSTAPSLRDLFEVPHSRFHQGESLFKISGVEIHANRIATLLDERDGRLNVGWIMPGWGNFILAMSCAIGGLLLGETIGSIRRSVLVVGLISIGVASGLGWLLWNQIWVGIAMPLTGLVSMGGAAWLRRGAMSQQHSQQIKQLLGQTTSPAVAQQLWDQRDELLRDGRFEGRQLPITVLFTDTASFTSVSEQLNPCDLMDWLNRGMAICVPAVTKRGGMVNKFTGDGMLAVFGVPIEQDISADAQAAIEASREIKAGLEKLNSELRIEGLPEMLIRLGIHSGDALVGSMGSAERIEYAVIGDTVNCASRLESLDKSRHDGVLRVLMSSKTLELLDPEFRKDLILENWGAVQVKGRIEPLEVSELKMDNEPAAE